MSLLPDHEILRVLHEAITEALQKRDAVIVAALDDGARLAHKTLVHRLHAGRQWIGRLLVTAREERDRPRPRRYSNDPDREAEYEALSKGAMSLGEVLGAAHTQSKVHHVRVLHNDSKGSMLFHVRAPDPQSAIQALTRILRIEKDALVEGDALTFLVSPRDEDSAL